MNDDAISRRAAIDGLKVGEELLSRVLEDTEVVGNVRDKYEWGLGLLKSCISDIEDLPPAQPEIIRCKDCKWWAVIPNDDSELSDYRACYALKHYRTKAIDFCSRAERISK